MYLELNFRKIEISMEPVWELFHAKYAEMKIKEVKDSKVKKVYLDNVAFMTIPELIEGTPVRAIAGSLKIPENVEVVIIPDSISDVADNAFYGARAHELRVGAGVYNLDFLIKFEQLKSLKVSPQNKYFVFYENNLYSADRTTLHWASNTDIWDGTRRIHGGAFNNIKADSLVLPPNVEKLSCKAFNKAQIDRVHIPFSVKLIAMEAFYECTFESLVIASSISEVNIMTFHLCKIGLLVFKDGIEKGLSFLKNGIYSCDITSLVLPKRTESVATSAFKISNLQEVCFAGKGYNPYIFENSLLQLKKIRYNLDSKEDITNLHFGSSSLKYLLQTKSLPLIVVRDASDWMEEIYW